MADDNNNNNEAAAAAAAGDENLVKLFVGQIPRVLQENDIEAMFKSFGPIKEVSILRGPGGVSKGCAFVSLTNKDLAQQAIQALHHSTTFDGCRSAMVVKYADNHDSNIKLFIGQIPRTFNEDNIKEMFAPYGEVSDVSILRHPDGVSKGCGFVTMDGKAKAQAATQGLDHSKTFEGCRSALVVRYADTDKEKMQKKMQNMHSNMMFMPQRAFLMQHQHHLMNMGGNMGNMQMNSQYGMGGFGMDGGLQQFYAGGYAQQPYGQQQGGPVGSNQGNGPDGANLFIYHLPKELDDNALATTFMPFGNVISAKVYVDPKTGESKCFGFVSYDNPVSAAQAIQAMDGMQIGPKRIKVSLKRAKGATGGGKFQPY